MARKPADQTVNRQDIILAAAEVLRDNGYESTTMKDIASQVNLTAASLYYHFKNKDELLLAVLEYGIDRVIEQIEPVVNCDKNNADKLSEMIRLHVVSITKNTTVGAAMVFEIRSLMNPNTSSGKSKKDRTFIERRNAFFARRDYFERLFRDVIQAGIDNDEFYPVDADIFVKTMLGAQNWVGVWYRDGGRLSGETIACMTSKTFLTALKQQ